MATVSRQVRILNGIKPAAAGVLNGQQQQQHERELKVVKIPELGAVQGTSAVSAWTQRKFYQFLGIRYAEPPVGRLRFKVRVVSSHRGPIFHQPYHLQ